MNAELYLVILPALGGLCFALGGTQISSTIPGQKWIRRFVLPFFLGIAVSMAGFAWFQAVGVAIGACAMLHMGYGDKTPWSRKWLVFAGYGTISLPIGISNWNLITAIACAALFLLSNFMATAKTFVWKIVEFSFGALIAIQVAYILAGYGLAWGIRP